MSRIFTAETDEATPILAALRQWLPGESWSAVRRLLHARRITINGVLCLDEGRRITPGETVTIVEHSLPPPPGEKDVRIRFIDPSFVVVDKPSGMLSVRRKSELSWPKKRRDLHPTLDEIVPRLIARHAAKKAQARLRPRIPRLFSVHRIDRDTSGLVVFARHDESQQSLIQQFAEHRVVRKYLAVIPGFLPDQTINSRLIRDRGDGLRGSTDNENIGQTATTHFRVLRRFPAFTELECRLETGKTNQIRIQLAEAGHPVCGDIKYRGPLGKPPLEDTSGLGRLALHAAQLGFHHPESGQPVQFDSPWPAEIISQWSKISGDV